MPGLLYFQGHLHTYRFCDNVWTFILTEACFKNEETTEQVGKAKIVACDCKLLGQQTCLPQLLATARTELDLISIAFFVLYVYLVCNLLLLNRPEWHGMTASSCKLVLLLGTMHFFSCVWLVHYLSTHSCHPSPAGAIVAASTLPNPSPRTAAGRRDPSIAMTMVHVDPSYNAQSTFSEIDPAQTTP
jgi:transcription initiation factor TFIIA small subunit